MKNTVTFYSVILMLFTVSFSAQSNDTLTWPGGKKVAVSLSYDDALNSQLDNAVPSLNKHKFRASFYLTLASSSIRERMPEWRAVAAQGHELGNHTIYHSCSGSMPNRDWVQPYNDLDKKSVELMTEEILTANSFLQAMDGSVERTFTVPCGDVMVNGKSFLPAVKDQFVAIKGQGLQTGFASLWGPSNVSGKELIDYVRKASKKSQLINIIFHGIGGDHLSVSTQAHDELLQYLAKHNDEYWVDSYINIMKHVNAAPTK